VAFISIVSGMLVIPVTVPTFSQLQCLVIFYNCGSTFFAASTLLPWNSFLDTAAMYALFRIADDLVDDLEVIILFLLTLSIY
jgi:phytoene/squalene synthetase